MFRVLHLPVASLLPVRPESETHISVLWSGNTWNYRSALDEAGVKGGYVEEEEGNGAQEDVCDAATGDLADSPIRRAKEQLQAAIANAMPQKLFRHHAKTRFHSFD